MASYAPARDQPPGQAPYVLSQGSWAHLPSHAHSPLGPLAGRRYKGEGFQALLHFSPHSRDPGSSPHWPPTLRLPLSQQGDRRNVFQWVWGTWGAQARGLGLGLQTPARILGQRVGWGMGHEAWSTPGLGVRYPGGWSGAPPELGRSLGRT